MLSFRFLYGKCKAPKCFLSHTSTPDNMPDCNFFLKGFCKEESCRYRHVKVNADAGICKDFATGFCSKGAKVNQAFVLNVCLTHSISIFQCESLHQFLCKSFFKTGQCPKGTKCTLAHLKVWPTAQAMIVGRKRSLAAASSKTAPVAASSTSSNASEAPKSKYRKVNPAINSNTSSSSTKMVPPATASVPKISSSTAARPNREMLNSLLARRLRCNSESNKQIVCQESDGLPKIDSSTEYIALSTDATATTTGAAASSDQAAAAASSQMAVITTTTKKNYPGTDPKRLGKYHHQASSSSSAPATATAATVLSSASSSAAAAAQVAPPPPQPAKRAKYFVVDHEEEKLFDYLTNFSTTSAATSVDSICRPQLKIIPDFLLGK